MSAALSRGLGVRVGVAAWLAVASWTGAAAAHPSHYAQALRATFGPGGGLVEVELSPGSYVVRELLDVLDGDRDGVISPSERDSYAAGVARSIDVFVDAARRPVSVESVRCPPVSHLETGESSLRISLRVEGAPLTPGPHALVVENRFHPGVGTASMQAFGERPGAVSQIVRDADGRRMTFVVEQPPVLARAPSMPPGPSWMVAAVATVVGAVALRAQRAKRGSAPASDAD